MRTRGRGRISPRRDANGKRSRGGECSRRSLANHLETWIFRRANREINCSGDSSEPPSSYHISRHIHQSLVGEPPVGVQTDAPQVHADVAHPHDDEPQRPDRRNLLLALARHQPRVQVRGVHEPGDERPRLLGIPGPVRTPRLVGPHGAADEPRGEQREARAEAPVRQIVHLAHQIRARQHGARIVGELARVNHRGDRPVHAHARPVSAPHLTLRLGILRRDSRGERRVAGGVDRFLLHETVEETQRALRPFEPLRGVHQQERHARQGSHQQRRVREHHHAHVHHEPVALQRGHERRSSLQLGGKREGGARHDHESGGRRERAGHRALAVPVPLGDDEVHAGDAPREEEQRLVHVGEGKVSRLDPARGEERGEGEVAREHGVLLGLTRALLVREERLVAVHAARAEERAEGRLAHDLLETAQREPERASHVAEVVGGGERAARRGGHVAAAGPTTRASHRRRECHRGRRVAAEEARRAGRGAGGERLRAMTMRPDGIGRRGARVGPRAGSRGRSRERSGRRDGRRRHRTNDA
mmetsp:Transcript_5660/g.23247  ORF Transcript_5660/g.23247 Transcript_5660/m.23247 type:complete len:532 (+) Transcript_5660:3094-4689(+)